MRTAVLCSIAGLVAAAVAISPSFGDVADSSGGRFPLAVHKGTVSSVGLHFVLSATVVNVSTGSVQPTLGAVTVRDGSVGLVGVKRFLLKAINLKHSRQLQFHLPPRPGVGPLRLGPGRYPVLLCLDVDSQLQRFNSRTSCGKLGAIDVTKTSGKTPSGKRPTVAIQSGPEGQVKHASAVFRLASSSGSRLLCRLDGGPWMLCRNPAHYWGLVAGLHTFEVRAFSRTGVPSSRSARASWVVPLTAVRNTGLPTDLRLPEIYGTLARRETLHVWPGVWQSRHRLRYSYQWQRCDSRGRRCKSIVGATDSTYRVKRSDNGYDLALIQIATATNGQSVEASASPVGPVGTPPPSRLTGIHKIQHVIVITQENRSFDNYFGTFPGADGIPSGTCVPDPASKNCVAPFHDSSDVNSGGPHGENNAIADINGGAMNGYIQQAQQHAAACNPDAPAGCLPCQPSDPSACDDVMGYHNGQDIPNYWQYARDFVLQDHLFASSISWSLIEHLYMVSAWAAACTDPNNPYSCTSSNSNVQPNPPGTNGNNGPATGVAMYPWTDLTYLLDHHNVSWRYYVQQGTEPDCENDQAEVCSPVKQAVTTPGIWNPLPEFTDVHQDNQLGNVKPLAKFYSDAKNATLPSVSWIVPSGNVSEHPPGRISLGQQYVTGLINAIMNSRDWGSTAIFLSWDDWGGFYDQLRPPNVDGNGYGLRVPGILISPYAKKGYIDHQVLSHDAYLKFIEDDFLGGQRLDPATDGRPDPRPDVRENAPQLGDLASEFDFSQKPRPREILSTCPPTDLTPKPAC